VSAINLLANNHIFCHTVSQLRQALAQLRRNFSHTWIALVSFGQQEGDDGKPTSLSPHKRIHFDARTTALIPSAILVRSSLIRGELTGFVRFNPKLTCRADFEAARSEIRSS
jgi:hypothetical protein